MDKTPARVLPARAAEGDPAASSARRTRRRPRSTSCAGRSRRPSCRTTSARQADRELSRLERLPPAAAEYGVIRTYLEWILSLPWSQVDRGQPRHGARAQGAGQDHYDIEKVKDRILEHLAVRKLKPDARGSILCFVGPPGVGKTSLGSRSRARWGASSSASPSAACATRPRSAATAARTSARCPARSSARCATPRAATRCS